MAFPFSIGVKSDPHGNVFDSDVGEEISSAKDERKTSEATKEENQKRTRGQTRLPDLPHRNDDERSPGMVRLFRGGGMIQFVVFFISIQPIFATLFGVYFFHLSHTF